MATLAKCGHFILHVCKVTALGGMRANSSLTRRKHSLLCRGGVDVMEDADTVPDPRAKLYTDALVYGTKDSPGFMLPQNAMGQENVPYTHQRAAVKKFMCSNRSFFAFFHALGVGKTASALQAVCAEALLLGRRPKVLISAPSATLDQWHDSVFDWLRVDDPRTVLVTSELRQVTQETLTEVDILVVPRDLISRAFATSYAKYEKHHQIETGPGLRWVSQWERIDYNLPQGPIPLHPLMETRWDMLIIDEAHFLRNSSSRWCEAHATLARLSTKRLLLTGTFVVNRPQDLAGICKAGGAPTHPIDFCDKKAWVASGDYSGGGRTVNLATVEALRSGFTHHADDNILQLPHLNRECVAYQTELPTKSVVEYNRTLADARNLKLRIEREGSHDKQGDIQKLLSLIGVLQQMVVSPLLSKLGSARFNQDNELFTQAASTPTGALLALEHELCTLQSRGHARIVIAGHHVSILRIAKLFLAGRGAKDRFGEMFTYFGSQTREQRCAAKRNFLGETKSLLFLSIAAGGCGLHLVPGCQAMVFWGSMPFSPAIVQQCFKRIHRIGQDKEVDIVHMISYGSVDHAIAHIHGDKNRLIRLVHGGDYSAVDSEDATWRKVGRIVDHCLELRDDGNFPPMPTMMSDGAVRCGDDGNKRLKLPLQPFTLLDGVVTRVATRANASWVT